MKKLFFMLICLFVLYLGIQFVFTLFSKGNQSDYIIKQNNIEFVINEQSVFSNNVNNYEYSITGKNNTFNFQIDYNFGKSTQVIKDIKYFNDDRYECILPIFKNNLILMDFLCYSNGKLNYYFNIKGKNKNLDLFVKGIEEYKEKQFSNDLKVEKIEGIYVYKGNLISNHYIGITNYKGIYDISKDFNSVVYNFTLFKKDVYNPKVAAFVDEYYVTADYDKEHQFNIFKVLDLTKLNDFNIASDKAISLDSYVQGVVDGKLYIYDKDNKIQYEINVEKKSIATYSGNNIKYYKDGVWTTMSIAEANNGLKFTEYSMDIQDNNYDRIDKVGKEVGYYYLYKKNGNVYDVYRKSINNEESLIYLFSTKTIDSIYYIDNYVYYINGDILQVYKDDFGVKNILQFRELEFNKNLKFNVYYK